VKKGLLKDIKNFLDPRLRKWYLGYGIPYQQGYLLYRPPKTGKSSLSLSIAGCFDLDIYILNLPSVNDSLLSTLFAKLPPRYVVLLEDVDATTATQSQETRTENSSHIETVSTEVKPQGKVSLSCLLNVLDGVALQEG
jgi:mitochondrial chaperone BCS1